MSEKIKEPAPQPVNPSMFDDYAPLEMARRIETVGVAKSRMAMLPTLTLAILAGAFIAFGAMFYMVVVTETTMGLGPSRLLGGVAFSLGLILVVIGGAELFTGNVLIVMGWANGKVEFKALLRNWGLAYTGNFIGAVALAVLGWWSGFHHMGGDAVAGTAVGIAYGKVNLPFDVAFVRGVLCNALVCLAVWLCFAAHSVTSKILSILFPISAFVALGFEHSIANMFFIPFGMLAGLDNPAAEIAAKVPDLDLPGFIGNLIPVTLGNIVGGSVFVALSYYLTYLRGR